MAEGLSELLLKEKIEFIAFLKNDKGFNEDIKNIYGKSFEEILSEESGINSIFDAIDAYASWNKQSRIYGIIRKNYPLLSDYQRQKEREYSKLSSTPIPNDWDPHDSCIYH